MRDWKQLHANESEKAIQHPVVQDAIDELLFNLGRKRDSLPHYGISKVASYAAQVARAQALGIDPDLLRQTDDEADQAMRDLARRATEAKVPVWVVKKGDVE